MQVLIRQAKEQDAPEIARLHVQAWHETYSGLLPESEIAARGYDVRLAQWQGQLAACRTRIAIHPGLGFAQIGPQRDRELRAKGYGEELYCLYLLKARQGRGLGRALVAAVAGHDAFTALVLSTNEGACGFYRAMGGQQILIRPERIGRAEIEEIAFGFAGRGPRDKAHQEY